MEILGIYVSEAVLWLALAVVFLIIEGVTVGLTTIWFAAGSFAALILSTFDAPFIAQVIVFLLTSFCLLLFTRKIFVEKLKTGKVATNVEALIGETGQVIADVGPLDPGQVKVKGQEWSAVSSDETAIEAGRLVKIIAIEGVKLIVTPAEEQKG